MAGAGMLLLVVGGVAGLDLARAPPVSRDRRTAVTFLWPWALALLLLLPVLVGVRIWGQRRRSRPAVRYSSLSLIAVAGPGSSRIRRHLPFALFLGAIAALVLAVARPVAVLAVPTSGATILLTMDVSGSMCSTDIEPSRLQAAEAAASDFVEQQAGSLQDRHRRVLVIRGAHPGTHQRQGRAAGCHP